MEFYWCPQKEKTPWRCEKDQKHENHSSSCKNCPSHIITPNFEKWEKEKTDMTVL